MRKLPITDKDRLLAAGLMALLVAFGVTYGPLATNGTIVVFSLFAAGAFAFSLSPARHGSVIQKLLAVLFMLPSLAFFVVVFLHWRLYR